MAYIYAIYMISKQWKLLLELYLIMIISENLEKFCFGKKCIPLYEWHIYMPSKIMCLHERELI